MKMKSALPLLVGMMTYYFFPIGGAIETLNNINDSVKNNRLIDLGNGRTIYLECEGTGSPTVIFVSGRSDRSDIWKTVKDTTKSGQDVFHAIAKITHVCVYDRPGTFTIQDDKVEPSRSSPVLQPITPKDSVEDLHALLKSANIKPPLILVGHSFGGLIVRLYAMTYPDEVAGLVLVDTLTEFLYESLNPAQQKLWIRLNSNYSTELDKYTIQERTDFVPSFEQFRSLTTLRNIPAIVLTSDETYDFKDLISKVYCQRELL